MGIPGIEEYDINLSIPQSRIDHLVAVQPDDVEQADELSFARNVFIPLTTACRYTCTYCTYFDPPGQASLLSPDEIRDIVQMGVNTGCTEALFTFGDDPDDRYTAIYDQLHEFGHDSIHSYLREACEIALDAGLLPHSNPGDQTYKQMQMVADVNASMGVMLETTADVDAHSGPRTKNPGQRLHTLKVAGELNIPFTTGILVGIGESWEDRAKSLLAIKEMHERYGHIQEVIIQNVVQNERWTGDTPSPTTMRKTVAM
ncbi:MAG: 7,8-didemethyl-8-hydroxy-5-deazariboflavin synthase subunit CofG, partial [Halobacteriaceae archaeon]